MAELLASPGNRWTDVQQGAPSLLSAIAAAAADLFTASPKESEPQDNKAL